MAGWIAAGVLACALAITLARARRRDEAIARATHELRGPLTAAGLALHATGRGPVPVAAIELELRRAALAASDVEAARRGSRSRYSPEVVDLAGLLADQVACWAPAAAAAGSSVSLHSPSGSVYVAGDPTRLAQATGNLIANAIEHGRGTVEVRLRHQAETVRVEVADEGPGLPDLPRRLSERARGGRARRGRGLAIAAEIAERHGGRLGTIPTDAGAAVTIELTALETAVDERALA